MAGPSTIAQHIIRSYKIANMEEKQNDTAGRIKGREYSACNFHNVHMFAEWASVLKTSQCKTMCIRSIRVVIYRLL